MTVDIPGAFMQADMDEIIHMKLDGPLAELLVRVDPELYGKYVVIENGVKVVLKGLQVAHHLNGSQGKVVRFSNVNSRYVVKLCDGDENNATIMVKPQNAIAPGIDTV